MKIPIHGLGKSKGSTRVVRKEIERATKRDPSSYWVVQLEKNIWLKLFKPKRWEEALRPHEHRARERKKSKISV